MSINGNRCKVRHKTTGEVFPAIQWTGKNSIQIKQFGKAPYTEYVKVNCRNVCKVKEANSTDWTVLKTGEYLVMVNIEKHTIYVYPQEHMKYYYTMEDV